MVTQHPEERSIGIRVDVLRGPVDREGDHAKRTLQLSVA
jgi:hypothetical protein